MSHEHRQNPERYYDDEGEAYDDDQTESRLLVLDEEGWFYR